MRQLILLIGLIIVLVTPSFAEEAEINVGVILPLSGDNSTLGNYLKKGIELGYESLEPSLRKKISLYFEDDRLEAIEAVGAYKKLRASKNVSVVMVLGSGIGNALAPLAERDEVVLKAIGASDHNIVKSREFAFTHWVTPEAEARVLVKELKRRNYSSLARVGTEQEGAIALWNAVKEELKAYNLLDKLVLEKDFLPGERDFRSFVTRLKAEKPEAVIAILFPGAISSFTKQARRAGYQGQFVGLELFEDAAEIKAAEGTLDGSWYVSASKAGSDFVSAYEKAYGETPGWGAANAYDSLLLIAAALSDGKISPKAIANYLSSVEDFTGATGTYSATGDNRFNLPAEVKVIENGEFKSLAD